MGCVNGAGKQAGKEDRKGRLVSILRSRWQECPVCNGDKTVENDDGEEVQCPECKGKGKIIGPSMM